MLSGLADRSSLGCRVALSSEPSVLDCVGSAVHTACHLHSMFRRSQCEHLGLCSLHFTFRCLRGDGQSCCVAAKDKQPLVGSGNRRNGWISHLQVKQPALDRANFCLRRSCTWEKPPGRRFACGIRAALSSICDYTRRKVPIHRRGVNNWASMAVSVVVNPGLVGTQRS